MLVIQLKPSERAERYLIRDNIELRRLETVLNFISKYMDKRKKAEFVTITFDIDCRKEDSEYYFKSKHICIGGISYNDKKVKTRAGRLKYLISCLIHEFRHCMQEILFNKNAKDITYGDLDVKKELDAYRNNPLEKDANWFEQKYAVKAYNLYRFLKKCKLKNVEIFHE